MLTPSSTAAPSSRRPANRPMIVSVVPDRHRLPIRGRSLLHDSAEGLLHLRSHCWPRRHVGTSPRWHPHLLRDASISTWLAGAPLGCLPTRRASIGCLALGP